jgi:hypothetical protein
MKPLHFLLALTVLMLHGCVNRNAVQTTFAPAYPQHLDAGDAIVAVFAGRIPCAEQGCEMRKIELVLYGKNAGQTPANYWLGQLRVGMGNDRLVQQGTWTIQRGLPDYPGGSFYALDSRADPSLRNLWRVNDEIVLVLDDDLRPKAGNAAWGFMLSRDCTPYGPKTYAYDKRARRFVPAVSSSGCRRSSVNR